MTIAGGSPLLIGLQADDRTAAIADVKRFARIATDEEDDIIARAIDAATGLAEQFIGQLAICRTVTVSVAPSARWQGLQVRPVAAITDVVGIGQDGMTIDGASDAYAIDIDADGDGFVRVTGRTDAVRLDVTASAGLAVDWSSLPAALRQGIVMLASHLLDQRDANARPPAAITALWRPFRRMRLAERVPA